MDKSIKGKGPRLASVIGFAAHRARAAELDEARCEAVSMIEATRGLARRFLALGVEPSGEIWRVGWELSVTASKAAMVAKEALPSRALAVVELEQAESDSTFYAGLLANQGATSPPSWRADWESKRAAAEAKRDSLRAQLGMPKAR